MVMALAFAPALPRARPAFHQEQDKREHDE
jgi:hypothetical protein